jgi:hypothetical protein
MLVGIKGIELQEPAEEPIPDRRASRRTNLLLTASIEFNGVARQVRIRNVSETGAMIEGTHVPNKGVQLTLTRADLQVGATVAWSTAGKAGIHFDEPLPVEIWSGGKPKLGDAAGIRDQGQVDAVQRAIRAGLPTSAYEAPSTASVLEGELNTRIADEIRYVVRLIESLGDQLSGDPVVLHKHAKSLQNIDLANQILSHLAALITADDPAARVAEIGMIDLRARLTRKALS